MKLILYIISLLSIIIFLTDCEEDVIAPVAKSPYPIVFCVLDKDDTAHYVRLTKTFSGPVDVNVMAQNPDSLYYKNARVFAEMPGKTVELEPTHEIKRDSGLFFSGYSLLFKTTYRLCGSVRILIYLPDAGTEIIGSTTIMGARIFVAPDTTKNKFLSFYEPEPVRIIWNGTAGVCQTTIRFKYLEITDSGMDTCRLDWIRKSADFAIMPVDLLDYLNHWIHDKPEVRYRKVLGFDILVTTGNGQLANYLAFKDWSIDIIEKPYSNLINAYGLIASRVSGALTDYLPNQRFIDTLVNISVTEHLRFVRW
ncbi:MAG: hypothetical protein D4R64_06910 [Porphyromonadaceae bacterium]|nr:MAG: hypothetical protein D4R64_06910 [Porphyromonadaceae bacterium]